MRPRYWASLAALAVLATGSGTLAEIREWGGATGGYTIVQVPKRILITIPGVYKFESVTNGQLDDINLIETELTQGQYNEPIEAVVYIARDPNVGTGPGCRDLGRVVPGNGLPVSLGECRVSRDIATLGSTALHSVYGGADVPGDVANWMVFSGDIDAPLAIHGSTYALTITGDVSAPLTLEGYASRVQNDGLLSSTLILESDGGGLFLGGVAQDATVQVGGDVDDLSWFGPLEGAVTVNGSIAGISAWGNLSGSVSIGGNLGVFGMCIGTFEGTLSVVGDLTSYVEFWPLTSFTGGAIDVNGNAGGTWILPYYPSHGDLRIGGTLTGLIHAQQEVQSSYEPMSGT